MLEEAPVVESDERPPPAPTRVDDAFATPRQIVTAVVFGLLVMFAVPALVDSFWLRIATSAVIYSLMLTCRACGVEPLAWLRHVLTELPQRTEDADVGDLLPFNFPKTTAAA